MSSWALLSTFSGLLCGGGGMMKGGNRAMELRRDAGEQILLAIDDVKATVLKFVGLKIASAWG
jgi:hypothetical protein